MKRNLAIWVLAPVLILSILSLPQRAYAQDPATSKSESKSNARATSASSKRSSESTKRIVIDEEFLVEGELEKPSAYYVFRRSALDYDWARLDVQFAPLVYESVQDPLF